MKTFSPIRMTCCLALLILSFNAIFSIPGKIIIPAENVYGSVSLQDDSAFARQKRDLIRRIEILRNNVDAQLTQLRAESSNAKKEAQKDYKASIDKLQKMSRQLEGELEETKSATSAKWTEFMNKMNKNADEVDKEWKQLQSKIKRSLHTEKDKKEI